MHRLLFGHSAHLLVCGVAALAASAARAEVQPRYWASEVSFVTPASHVEAKPVAATPSAEPLRSDEFVAEVEANDRPRASREPHVLDPPPAVAKPIPVAQRQPAIRFYDRRAAQASLAAMPGRPAIQPAAYQQPAPRRGRKFESASNRSPISPYLNLYRDESESAVVPIYHTHVRPQLDQQEINRRQQRELDQIDRRPRGRATTTVGPQSGFQSSNGRRAPARFMDTAQFYSGWQR